VAQQQALADQENRHPDAAHGIEGKDYPLFKLDTSSESHPFYTGTQKSVDNMGGRVERFRNRFGKK
jgi:ribosomal protein L31